ncbi:hypothetical protein D3272_09070 [Lichenibacterium ramalinae]|uniref:Uncharacterized protein n=2 Tax=Lichenibacterium ramalinae TaxID=2316527 RepID=A0A4Q2RGM6_9HYPH|nr:hypothetical protein D3272_09070 [Lichenibacterium ramalinae]
MLKQIGAKYGEDARKSAEVSATAAARRSGLDPKAAPSAESAPVASEIMSAEASRAYARKSMLAMVERRYGTAARAQAEARIAARRH